MTTQDEFRFRAHELIVELDATTSEMMKLIAAHQMTGPEWEHATRLQHEAYERWLSYLNDRVPPESKPDTAPHVPPDQQEPPQTWKHPDDGKSLSDRDEERPLKP